MDATFERGSASNPRGHALCYFREDGYSPKYHAIYVIVSPVPFAIGKYLPPILAGQVSQFEMGEFASVALPPIPEEVAGLAYLQALAEARDDDLLDGGSLPGGGGPAALPRVQEIVGWYGSLYEGSIGRRVGTPDAQESLPEPEEVDADSILYSVLGDRERLAEITKLLGSLRYGLEVHDGAMVQEAEARMAKIGRLLPESFRATELISAAGMVDERGQRLAELYLQRCYKLLDEDYAAVGELERQISQVQVGT